MNWAESSTKNCSHSHFYTSLQSTEPLHCNIGLGNAQLCSKTSYTAASQKHILPVIIFHVAGMLHLDAVEFSISFTEWLSLIQHYSEPCSTLPSTFDQKSGVISAPTASHSTAWLLALAVNLRWYFLISFGIFWTFARLFSFYICFNVDSNY